MVEIRPAILDDFKQLHGRGPIYTTRALAMVEGGTVLMLGGLYTEAGHAVMYLDVAKDARPRMPSMSLRRALLHGQRALRAMALELGLPVIARPDREAGGEGAERLMRHAGFTQINERGDWAWLPHSR